MNADYASICRDALLSDAMPFWLLHGMDHEHGGLLCITSRCRNIGTT